MSLLDEINAKAASDPDFAALLAIRNDAGMAVALSVGRTAIVECRITERTVRALAVTPRSRYALLKTLADAETTTPAWMTPTMTAAGIPVDDQPAYCDDLASAHRWLTREGGIDVGAPAARAMLDMISIGVPDAAEACAAVKGLAVVPAVLSGLEISEALNGR